MAKGRKNSRRPTCVLGAMLPFLLAGTIANAQSTIWSGYAGNTSTQLDYAPPTGTQNGTAAVSTTQTLFDVAAGRPVPLSAQLTLLPQVKAGWQHEFANHRAVVTARIPGGTGFAVETADFGRNAAALEAGMLLQTATRTSLFADYTVLIGANANAQNLSGGLRVAF